MDARQTEFGVLQPEYMEFLAEAVLYRPDSLRKPRRPLTVDGLCHCGRGSNLSPALSLELLITKLTTMNTFPFKKINDDTICPLCGKDHDAEALLIRILGTLREEEQTYQAVQVHVECLINHLAFVPKEIGFNNIRQNVLIALCNHGDLSNNSTPVEEAGIQI